MQREAAGTKQQPCNVGYRAVVWVLKAWCSYSSTRSEKKHQPRSLTYQKGPKEATASWGPGKLHPLELLGQVP